MICLVTGGAGFIGSNLVDRLITDGHTVRVIDNLSTGKAENVNQKAEFHNRDITDTDLLDVFKSVDVVFHLAAKARVQPSIKNPLEFDKVNVHGTLNILHT